MLKTYEPTEQPIIRLDSFHLARLEFKLDQEFWETHELKDTQFKINFTHLTKDDRDNYFGVLFTVFIRNLDKTIDLNFDFIGHFEVKGQKIEAETIGNNNFFRYNAPAIVFPYIRSFVSNFMLNSGFKPIILPSINFTNSTLVNNTNNEDK